MLDTSLLSECNLRNPLTVGSRIRVAVSDSVYLLLPRICVGQGDPSLESKQFFLSVASVNGLKLVSSMGEGNDVQLGAQIWNF